MNANNSIKELATKPNVIFTILLVAVFFFLGYSNEIFKDPYGIHFFRQVDSLSFVLGYYNNGMSFFEPQLFNLKSIDGKTASEFPIVYYFVAALFKVFGIKMYLLKWIHLAITYVGIVYLFRLVQDWLQDYWYSFLVTLLIFSSTIFNYYAFNYLPDTAALGFTFIGLFFINRYWMRNQTKSLLYASLFFGLGSLIKITYLIYPFSILIAALFIVIFSRQKQYDSIKIKSIIISIFSILLIVVLWNIYTIYYNNWNHSTFFLYKPIPIWDMTGADIAMVWTLMSEYWYSKYLAYTTHHILWAMLFLQIIRINKTNKLLSAITLLSLLGFITYILLFFRQFQDHDYYILVGFPLFTLILTQGVLSLKTIINKPLAHRLIQLALLVIVISGINYSRMKLGERFQAPVDNYNHSSYVISKNLTLINQLNIPVNAKIVIGPDESHNGAFLHLNRKGWTIPFNEHIDFGAITEYKKYGATYFILMNNDVEKEELLLKFGDRILNKKDLEIYRL